MKINVMQEHIQVILSQLWCYIEIIYLCALILHSFKRIILSPNFHITVITNDILFKGNMQAWNRNCLELYMSLALLYKMNMNMSLWTLQKMGQNSILNSVMTFANILSVFTFSASHLQDTSLTNNIFYFCLRVL